MNFLNLYFSIYNIICFTFLSTIETTCPLFTFTIRLYDCYTNKMAYTFHLIFAFFGWLSSWSRCEFLLNLGFAFSFLYSAISAIFYFPSPTTIIFASSTTSWCIYIGRYYRNCPQQILHICFIYPSHTFLLPPSRLIVNFLYSQFPKVAQNTVSSLVAASACVNLVDT